MTVMYCDICHKPIPPQTKRNLIVAVGQITRSQEVCEACFDDAQATDWFPVVRREILCHRHKTVNEEAGDVSL